MQGVGVRCSNFDFAAIVLATLTLVSSCLPGATIEFTLICDTKKKKPENMFSSAPQDDSESTDESDDDEQAATVSQPEQLLEKYLKCVMFLTNTFPVVSTVSQQTEADAIANFNALTQCLKHVYGVDKCMLPQHL